MVQHGSAWFRRELQLLEGDTGVMKLNMQTNMDAWLYMRACCHACRRLHACRFYYHIMHA